ncbi:hypothetical protein ACS0TY_023369 [Phlomoides rotata]
MDRREAEEEIRMDEMLTQHRADMSQILQSLTVNTWRAEVQTVSLLNLGGEWKATGDDKQMLPSKVSIIMQRLGIPALSQKRGNRDMTEHGLVSLVVQVVLSLKILYMTSHGSDGRSLNVNENEVLRNNGLDGDKNLFRELDT